MPSANKPKQNSDTGDSRIAVSPKSNKKVSFEDLGDEGDLRCEVCDLENGNEEAQGSAGIRIPFKPSAKEVEDHERTHLPFRDWCKHSV